MITNISIIIIIIIIIILTIITYKSIQNDFYKLNGTIHIDKFIKPKYDLGKNIAVCLSGQIRDGYEQTLLMQKIFLIDGLNADVFCCFENCEDDKKKFIYETLKPKKILWVNDYIPDKKNNISIGTLSMYNKIYLANQLKINYENEKNFKYDYVIRIRPDLLIKEYLPTKFFNTINTNTINMPIISPIFRYYGYPDFMAIGTSQSMDVFSDVFIHLIKNEQNTCNVSETLLYKYLNEKNINVNIYTDYPIQLWRFKYDDFENIYNSFAYIYSLTDRYILKNNC